MVRTGLFLRQSPGENQSSRRREQILATIELVSARRTLHALTQIHVPERFSCLGIERQQVVRIIACEHQIAGGGEDASAAFAITDLMLPANLSRLIVNGLESGIRPQITVAARPSFRLAFRGHIE